MENNRPKRPKWHTGGQHGAPQGVSTENYAYRGVGNLERLTPWHRQQVEAALADFNRELERAINSVDWSQPF